MTQIEYLEILLNDCGFGTRVQRNAYLSRICLREIHYLDEIRPAERSGIINTLLQLKEQQKSRASESPDNAFDD